MPTMGNVFCVRGRSGTGGRGAGPFFRIFGPDGFFMVGILVTVEGGVMRVARYKAGIFSTPARSMAIRHVWDLKEAHPGV
jgi:hypothetical protein